MASSNKLGSRTWHPQINQALNGKIRLDSFIEDHTKQCAIIFFVVTALLIFNVETPVKISNYPRGDLFIWYNSTASAFVFAMFFGWLAQVTSKSAEKKSLAKVLWMVNLMSATMYLGSAFRITPEISSINGNPLEITRFLKWMCTCPSMIWIIGEVTKTRKEKSDYIVWADYILLVFGFMGFITKEPISTFCSFAALLCFYHVISGLDSQFEFALQPDSGCKLDPITINIARYSTIFSWSFFPITFFLLKFCLIDYVTSEIMFCIADIVAKVVTTLLLANATIEQSQIERVDDLTQIAQNMEQVLSNSDALLEKMMPKGAMEQMKKGVVPGAEEYESVTVFFSDITNFSTIVNNTNPRQMLDILHNLWLEYDKLGAKWGMYKVETIGDAFLGVMGCPEHFSDHAERAVSFSLDALDMVRNFKNESNIPIEIRIGMHSGKITAGVLGDQNPHWCIVGDTVNTASRMESTSNPMKIHISDSTFFLIRNCGKFKIEGPDEMNIKGKGVMNTYWISGWIE